MNTLPKINKWILLLIVAIVSVAITSYVFLNSSKQVTDLEVKVTPTPTQMVENKNVNSDPVLVNLEYNYTEGYVDVFLSTKNMVEHGELLFNIKEGTKYSKIEEGTLFEKYLPAVEVDKATNSSMLRLGATKGIEGSPLNPGENLKFARIYFNELSEGSVTLNTEKSSFFVGTGAPDYPEYKVVAK